MSLLKTVSCFAVLGTLGNASAIVIVLATASIAMIAFSELLIASRNSSERNVWFAEFVLLAGMIYLSVSGAFTFTSTLALFSTFGLGLAFYGFGTFAQKRDGLQVLARPFTRTGLWLPLATVALGITRHISRSDVSWLGLDSLALLLAAGFYFWQGIETARKGFTIWSAVILNVALILFWRELNFRDPQFFMIPIGLTILFLVESLKRELPRASHDPLRYLGALTILVSPTFHIVGGSWLHLFTLMLASTMVLLLSIGLRIRALVYTGTAFLLADLIGMITRGSIDNPNLLWIAGVSFGIAIVVLGAFCENHREKVLQRMRILSSSLEQWN